MKLRELKGEGALLLTAIIWGSGFIMVDAALSLGFKPGAINMLRFILGALVLLLALNKNVRKLNLQELKTGIIAGICYFFGFYLQTIGLQYTNVSNNAILTATNLLLSLIHISSAQNLRFLYFKVPPSLSWRPSVRLWEPTAYNTPKAALWQPAYYMLFLRP